MQKLKAIGEDVEEKRWLDDVECDIKSLGIRNWRLKARKRLEWRAVGREAEVHFTGQ
jgi:hypothetical protein